MAPVEGEAHEVAVIGAGPAGLAVAAASTEQGFSAVVLDKGDAAANVSGRQEMLENIFNRYVR